MGSREYVQAEIRRLRLASSDMRQAAEGAQHLAGVGKQVPSDVERALETGVIVSYARPFTRQGIGQLDPRLWAPRDPEQAVLHDALIRLRNIRYAHTDSTELRGVEDVFGIGLFTEAWRPLSDRAWPRIADVAWTLEREFRELANALQQVLQALPEGDDSRRA